MRGAAEEKDLSPHECRDLGSMRRSMELDRRFLGWSVNLKKFRNIVGSLAINCFVDNEHQLEDDSLRDREPG